MKVLHYWKQMVVALLLVATLAGTVAAPAAHALSGAADVKQATTGAPGAGLTVGGVIQTVVKVLIFLVGAVAVIMIVIGGFRYTTSAGDQAAIKSAKNTILYSVVGLAVAIFAFAIVSFVLTQLKVK